MTSRDSSGFPSFQDVEQWLSKHQRAIHNIFLGMAVLLYFLINLGVPLPSWLGVTLIGVLIAWLLRDIAHNTYHDTTLTLCKDQSESDEIIKAWLNKTNHVKKAVIVDYSAHTIQDVLKLLLNANAEVTLYLQALDSVRRLGSKRQYGLVVHNLNELYTDFAGYFQSGRLQLKFYDVPPTINVIRIDDSILVTGYYIWEHIFDPNAPLDDVLRQRIKQGEFEKYPQYDDTIKLWGHSKPRIVAYRHTAEYALLDQFISHQLENFEIYNAVNRGSPAFNDMSPEAVSRAVRETPP